MADASRTFFALLRDKRGNVLPLTAGAVLISTALVGGGIDMSRAYRAKNRLQSACDAAVLAGRRAVESDGYDNKAKAQADSYFATNYNEANQGTTAAVFQSSGADKGQIVSGTATAKLNLVLMQIFGFKQFELAVDCESQMGMGNSDVVMVLDNTGSMDGSRIIALRAAMKNFYSTVETATTGTNARVRYGFVPYSSSVNVGKLLMAANPAWIRDSRNIYSRYAQPVGEETEPPPVPFNQDDEPKKDTSTSYSTQNGCEAQLGKTEWVDDAAPSTIRTNAEKNNDTGAQTWTTTERITQRRRDYLTCYKSKNVWYRTYNRQIQYIDTVQKWRMVYGPVSYPFAEYKSGVKVVNNTGDYGTPSTSAVWSGCIEERDTIASPAFAYIAGVGITPAANDLDIDNEPTTEEETKWSPMWKDVAWRQTSETTGAKPGSNCPVQARLLAEMNQKDFGDYADSLIATGNTYLDLGMVWGARLSSPNGIFSTNVNLKPSNGGEVSRHLIFMSDGAMETAVNNQTSWGIEVNDQRVSAGDTGSDNGRHSSRFRALCEAVRAKGIRVWTIYFGGSNTDLKNCASANSYYSASNSAQLNAAFQEIAKQVGELRLTQ